MTQWPQFCLDECVIKKKMLLYFKMFMQHGRCLNFFLNCKLLPSGAHLRQPQATTERFRDTSFHLIAEVCTVLATSLSMTFMTLCVFNTHGIPVLPFDDLFFVSVVLIASVFEMHILSRVPITQFIGVQQSRDTPCDPQLLQKR